MNIEVEKLRVDLCKKIQTMETILEFSKSISMGRNLKHVLDIILLTCMGHKGIQVTGILLADPEAPKIFKVRSVRGLDKDLPEHSVEMSGPMMKMFTETGYLPVTHAFLIENPGLKKVLDALNCALLVPLFYQAELCGVLSCSPKLTGQDYSRDDIDFLQLIASHSGIAISSLMSWDRLETNNLKLERTVFELKAVEEVNHALSGSLALDEVSHKLILTMTGYLAAESGVIYVHDQARQGRFLFVSHTGGSSDYSNAITLDSDTLKLIGGRSVVRNKGAMPGVFPEIFEELGMEICFPIGVSEMPIGLCFFGCKATGMSFKDQELELAALLVQQALSPIRNCLLYQSVEQRVVERTAQLEAATKAKSEFLANMSHEIRTPMNGIIASTDLAFSEEVSPRARYYLNIIRNSGYTLLGVINDILDFSKIEAGKLEVESNPFMLLDMMDNVTGLFFQATVQKKIELLVDIEAGTPMALMGDLLRTQQILTNLVGNAFKFTEHGGLICIGVKAEGVTPSGVTLIFFVKDTGVGIKGEELKRLFEPFSQANASTTRKHGGTGLGLTISKQLVELMSGKMWAESEPGKGSSFYFSIPFERQHESREEQYVFPVGMEKLRPLVVGTRKEGSSLLQKILESFGFGVETVGSARDALTLVEKKGHKDYFDLIISDMQMAATDYTEFLKNVKTACKNTLPVIVLGTYDQEEVFINGKIEIDGFVHKPVNTSTLYHSVMTVFGKAHLISGRKRKRESSVALAYTHKLKGVRVLVAEDNPVNQEIAMAILSKVGIEVTIANNGKEALEIVREKAFDAVLMDIQMPEMDGYEATTTIRQDPENTSLPIIAMTAHAMVGDNEKCLAAGMDAYITKPVNQENLLRTLWHFVQLKRLSDSTNI